MLLESQGMCFSKCYVASLVVISCKALLARVGSVQVGVTSSLFVLSMEKQASVYHNVILQVICVSNVKLRWHAWAWCIQQQRLLNVAKTVLHFNFHSQNTMHSNPFNLQFCMVGLMCCLCGWCENVFNHSLDVVEWVNSLYTRRGWDNTCLNFSF